MLISDKVKEIVVPACQILTSLWSAQPHLVDQSDLIANPDIVADANLGKLLKAQQYQVYTDFILTAQGQASIHQMEEIETLSTKANDAKDIADECKA